MNVAAVLMEILRSAGVRYLFGNPGTTELPFLDALPDSGLEYVLGLQEATAVAAADGKGQRAGRPAGANAPVGPGLATGPRTLTTPRGRRRPSASPRGRQATGSRSHG